MNKSNKICPTCKGKGKLPRDDHDNRRFPFAICDAKAWFFQIKR